MPDLASTLAGLLAVAPGEGKDFLTVEELAVKSGHTRKWVQDQLKLYNAAGLLEISRKKVKDLQGKAVEAYAYRLRDVETKKKER